MAALNCLVVADIVLQVRLLETNVAEDHFVAELRKSYKLMKPSVRARKVRELVSESRSNERFIREHFPEFLAEALTRPSLKRAGRRVVSRVRAARVAKQR